MKRMLGAVVTAILLAGTPLTASPSQGKNHKHRKHDRVSTVRDDRVAVNITFAKAEVTVLRHHYAPRYRNLPPGLQKKVARGGQLPPGWRKKFEPFPVGVERRLAPLPVGYRRGVIDGHAVIFNARSNVIVDVAVLF